MRELLTTMLYNFDYKNVNYIHIIIHSVKYIFVVLLRIISNNVYPSDIRLHIKSGVAKLFLVTIY